MMGGTRAFQVVVFAVLFMHVAMGRRKQSLEKLEARKHAEERMRGTLETMKPRLDVLPAGANVAVVTMLGSFCPLTLGHVQAFVEARKIFMGESGFPRPAHLEKFSEVLGFMALNPDALVTPKVLQKHQKPISLNERKHLVEEALSDLDWMAWESAQGVSMHSLQTRWKHLKFIKFFMNGADDIFNGRKYQSCKKKHETRMVIMLRPGYSDKLIKAMDKDGVDREDGQCVLGPELPDISSTKVRKAAADGDTDALLKLVHPKVAGWMLKQYGHEPGTLPSTPAVLTVDYPTTTTTTTTVTTTTVTSTTEKVEAPSTTETTTTSSGAHGSSAVTLGIALVVAFFLA